jgi:two-component system, NtrC family, sensor kinase
VLTLMLAAMVVVTSLAWWDEEREAGAALRDLGNEQAILASSLAGGLGARLASVERDAVLIGALKAGEIEAHYKPVLTRTADAARAGPSDPSRLIVTIPLAGDRLIDLGVTVSELLDGAQRLATVPDLLLLVSPPGDPVLYAVDGRALTSPPIRDALDRDLSALRLSRSDAAQLGLRERTAMAGLAHVDAGRQGRWNVVAVASAARERDREKRATYRLVLSVLVASSLVIVFGGAALRKQRKELELAHTLAVTEVERERDEQLLRAQRVATMGTFAMGIAHEVSTPLAVIVGRAEQLLGKLRDDERTTRSAEAILKQADRIQHIVRRFLDMARGGPLSFARTDPAAIVRAATAAIAHRFAKAQVSLATDLPGAMPQVQCDRDLLEYAIVNLLLNACEACALGGHVQVAARWDAECVAFVVTDDGVGISPENAARATEPFFTSRPASGTGLGLAIATEIAKSHRGSLTIAPNAERGTRACIEIPIAAERGPNG